MVQVLEVVATGEEVGVLGRGDAGLISEGKSEMDMRVGLKAALPLRVMTASVVSILGGRTMEAALSTRLSASRVVLGALRWASLWRMTRELRDRTELTDERFPRGGLDEPGEALAFPLLGSIVGDGVVVCESCSDEFGMAGGVEAAG